MADNTLESKGKVLPKDLVITSQPDSIDKDKSKVVATGLKIDSSYAFQFQYVYPDGEVSEWSPGYILTTADEIIPAAPSVSVPGSGIGIIPVTLNSFPTNASRVDIYIIGGQFGAGKVVDNFLAAGTKNISVPAGEYQVSLITVTPSGLNGTPTSSFNITVISSSIDTSETPGAPSNVTVNAFNEASDPLNRTGYINVSWTAGSSASGYWVGIWEVNPDTNPTAKAVEQQTTDTTAKIEGLFVGKSYYVKVKSENKFNNSSSWVAPASNYPVTIPGTALVPGAVTISGTSAPRSIIVSWGDPASNAALVTNGGYYEVKLYTNSGGTGIPLETRKAWSNTASFSGLTTGTSYWVTVQPYTAGAVAVAGTLSTVYGPLIPTAIDNPDLKGDFILANNQLQVGSTSGANDVHLSAYTKTVSGQSVQGRIYIGGPETSGSAAVGLYNDSGTPFYADNLGRLSLGDKLTWSGSALSIKGTIDVTGASTFSSYVLAGATNSTFIGIGYQVPYRSGGTLLSGASGLTGIVINSSGSVTNSDYIKSDGTFSLANGALTFSGGTLTATGNISATSLSANATITTPQITGGSMTGTSLSIGSQSIGDITNVVHGTGVNNIPVGQIEYTVTTTLAVGDTVSISGIASSSPSVTITNAVANGTSITYTGNNSFSNGQTVTVSGITPSQFNLKGVITSRTSTTFTIASNIFGTYISGGVAGSPHVFDLTNVSVYEINNVTTLSPGYTTGIDTYITKFRVLSGLTGTYTSGGRVLANPFRVSSTGIVRAASGTIGGWQFDNTKLRSSASDGVNKSYISLEPITGKISIITGATFTSGYPSGGTEAISISADNGIRSANNSFILSTNGTLTLSGTITAGSGSTIGGWSILGSAIQKQSSYTDLYGTPQTLTTTLGSNSTINLSSTTSPNAALNDISSVDNLLRVNHSNANTIVGPGQLEIASTSTLFLIQPTKLITWVSAGDYSINIKWSGGKTDGAPETVSPAKIRWWNYMSSGGESGQRTANLWPNRDIGASNTGSGAGSNAYRALLVDTSGYQYLGPIFYFSTTQATTPGTGIGEDGDLYFTTA